MDFTSLYYFSEVAKDLNMTKTADRLYISQQTLSNHIQRLESYYNAPLLYRKPRLQLTNAGKYVLDYARKMERNERRLRDMISDESLWDEGTLQVGATVARGIQIFPNILPAFFRRYPKVRFDFREGTSDKQERMLSNGEVDFAIVFPHEYGPELTIRTLLQDQVYLCAAEELLQRYYTSDEISGIKSVALNGVDIQTVDRLPFSVMTTRLGRQVEAQARRKGTCLHTYFSGPSSLSVLPMCAQGVTAVYCTHMALVSNPDKLGKNINIFPLHDEGKPIFQTLSLLWYKQRYLPGYARYFMELLFDFVETCGATQIARIV